MEFRRPEVVERWCGQEGRVAVGDRARIKWEPSLLRHLMSGQPRLGAGTHPMSALPLGIMTEAALVAAGREHTGIDVLVYANVRYRNAVPSDTAWQASATVREMRTRHVKVQVELTDLFGATLFTEGKLGVARIVDGKASSILQSGETLTP